MAAKKKAVEKEVEFNAEQTKYLELKDARILDLERQVIEACDKNELLAIELNKALEENVYTQIEGISTKQRLLMQLAPQVDITHPQSSAQKVLAAVDVIMNVWGME